MSGIHVESDDPLIGSIRALRAEVQRWIDAEIRARLVESATPDPSSQTMPAPTPKPPTPAAAIEPRAAVATESAETTDRDDPQRRLDALAARLEGRLRQGLGRTASADKPTTE